MTRETNDGESTETKTGQLGLGFILFYFGMHNWKHKICLRSTHARTGVKFAQLAGHISSVCSLFCVGMQTLISGTR